MSKKRGATLLVKRCILARPTLSQAVFFRCSSRTGVLYGGNVVPAFRLFLTRLHFRRVSETAARPRNDGRSIEDMSVRYLDTLAWSIVNVLGLFVTRSRTFRQFLLPGEIFPDRRLFTVAKLQL